VESTEAEVAKETAPLLHAGDEASKLHSASWHPQACRPIRHFWAAPRTLPKARAEAGEKQSHADIKGIVTPAKALKAEPLPRGFWPAPATMGSLDSEGTPSPYQDAVAARLALTGCS
jgi:hypothetical protein